jgi:hypothetical protein
MRGIKGEKSWRKGREREMTVHALRAFCHKSKHYFSLHMRPLLGLKLKNMGSCNLRERLLLWARDVHDVAVKRRFDPWKYTEPSNGENFEEDSLVIRGLKA